MDDAQKKAQEMYMEFHMLSQHIQQMQKQLEMITTQLMELKVTSNSLDEFKKLPAGRETLIPLSSGIFAKATLKDSKELLVNIGANVVVKKDIESTKELITKQFEDMKKFQKQLIEELEQKSAQAESLETDVSAG